MKKTTMSLTLMALLTVAGQARDQIKMVGSSTVYPFASAVAEELGATGGVPTPVVESTGTGGGMKMFCAGDGMDTPDITNASRRMKTKEFAMCKQNGVTDITEALIGYDGIVFAQTKANKPISLTRKELFMAVAADVPSSDGKSVIKNPYTTWNQINPALPNKPIMVYGPPKSSGTRDSFEEMVMQHFTEEGELKGLYHGAGLKKYSKIRTDGVWIDSGENDNLIVQKLTKNKNAFGVFGYSFLEENKNKIIGTNIDGAEPTPALIASGKYPISRSLRFYIKNSHRAAVPAIDKYAAMFMNDKMIGERGNLKRLGLIPLSKTTRAASIKNVLSHKKLTNLDLMTK
ncbi:MAG: PstS family phosphate ABC transporter substrate-binding protein [Campylobacterales bacterium]|nr:PstS family phosphate ABC transporter substrate-binding protein [Campylobacterales bacterium]